VIAVDQDSLGRQGRQISSSGGLDVLTKPLANGDVSVVLFNENAGGATISTTASAAGAPAASSYKLTNLWSNVVTSTSGAISTSTEPPAPTRRGRLRRAVKRGTHRVAAGT
jgi:alpha-galactosidase